MSSSISHDHLVERDFPPMTTATAADPSRKPVDVTIGDLGPPTEVTGSFVESDAPSGSRVIRSSARFCTDDSRWETHGMTRRVRSVLASAMAAVMMMAAGCGGGTDEPGDDETSSVPVSTEPALTAPPTVTPEEQAEAEILATFEDLIADRDQFYANASAYELAEISTSSPATLWSLTGEAELEVSNWTVRWRENEVQQVGSIDITAHSVSDIMFAANVGEISTATSVACLDLTSLGYRTYDGAVAQLPYEPDQYQTWTMSWILHEAPAPKSGVDEAGWYVQTVDVTRNQAC